MKPKGIPPIPDSESTMSKKRSLKNLIVVGASFFLLYASYQSLQNLQSTMNAENGRGMQSQALISAVCMASCLLLPDVLIKTLGAKRTLLYTYVLCIPFIASNYNPRYEILIPSSILLGLALGPLSAVYSFYGTKLACEFFASGSTESVETILATFNGVLAFFLENTQIWGNLASYYLLSPDTAHFVNANNSCGIDFRREKDINPNLTPPSAHKRFWLVTTFLATSVIACALLGFFVDNLRNDTVAISPAERKKFVLRSCLASVRQACVPTQMLITPLTIYVGVSAAFYIGDFTQAYIACSWGLDHIGFVTVCLGVCGAFMALSVGTLVKYASQMAVIFLGACINVGCCISLYLWDPSPEYIYKYFLFAGFWGMADAIWWSQLGALYGLMFPNDREAAFSNLYFWTFLGFTLSFSYANSFTVATKITILLCFLITGIVGYFISQVRIRCYARREYLIIGEEE